MVKPYFLLFIVCSLICVVANGVNEGEPQEEFRAEYRKKEPEDPYHEQQLPEGFEDGKSNSTL
jgi:hypothetical protein